MVMFHRHGLPASQPVADMVIACIMKFGAMPHAADPENPTEDETAAIMAKVGEYQAVFDTH